MCEVRRKLPKKVLVTGASGYVGLHIVKQLMENNYQVRGTVRSLKNLTKVQALRDIFTEDSKFPIQIFETDLLKDEGWSEAVFECDYVIHTAGPYPKNSCQKESDLLPPLLDGTLRLLRACAMESKKRNLKRVVLNSSILTVHGETSVDESRVYNNKDWTDPHSSSTSVIAKCKTLAEKHAWEFIRSLPPEDKFELAVINGSMPLGPLLSNHPSSSHDMLRWIMDRRKTPLLPEIRLNICDVRDLAEAHIRVMILPEAAGRRHIIVGANLWTKEISSILHDKFGSLGYDVSQSYVPRSFLWVARMLSKNMDHVSDLIGKSYNFDSETTLMNLELDLRDIKCTLIENVHSLIQRGIIKRTKEYRFPEINTDNSKSDFLY